MDPYAFWKPEMSPAVYHGITTVLMGNCSVSLAPCAPDHRDFLAALMEVVEEVPKATLRAHLPWSWTSYGGYLDALEAAASPPAVQSLQSCATLNVYSLHYSLQQMYRGAWRDDLATERNSYRVGPNCETWPNSLTENPYQSLKVGPQFGPILYNFRSRRASAAGRPSTSVVSPHSLRSASLSSVGIGLYPIVTLGNQLWYEVVELYCKVSIGFIPR